MTSAGNAAEDARHLAVVGRGGRLWLRRGLEADGFVVLTAIDGDQGLELARSSEVDVVVLDLGLPAVDGMTLLRRWRALRALSSKDRKPSDVDRLPSSPDLRIGVPGQGPAPTTNTSGNDSFEAVRFKESLRNAYAVDAAERTIETPVRNPLVLQEIAQASLDALHPVRTIQSRILASIFIPLRIPSDNHFIYSIFD